MWKYLFVILVSLVVPVILDTACSRCSYPVAPEPSCDKGNCRVVCYFSSWAVYRPGPGKFDVENINASSCTHLIYAFIGINTDGTIKIDDPANDLTDNGGKGAMQRFVDLKSKNPGLKTMVAIGGWNEGSVKFSQVAGNETLRARFVQNVVVFLKKFCFDGLDFDWEYPARNGGAPEDVNNFVLLLKELRSAFSTCGFILSVAVGATQSAIDESYNVKKINEYVAFINLMTYDYHGSWDGFTGYNSPLFGSVNDQTDFQKQLNIDASVTAWISAGAKPCKINLGIPFYGRTYTLKSETNNGLGASTVGPGKAGPYTQASGTLSQLEINQLVAENWTVVSDEVQKVIYLYKGDQWISAENHMTIAFKLDYAWSKKLGGVMMWSIDQDDHYELTNLLGLWCYLNDLSRK